MTKWTVEFYEKQNGVAPTSVFLDGIKDLKLKAKVLRDIELLQEFGNTLREPYSSYLVDGIFELRSKQSSNIVRMLYFFVIKRKIIITHGFIKKTQKTPSRELETAINYRNDYEERHK